MSVPDVPLPTDACDRHRPTDAEGVRLAVCELRRQRLSTRDIAQALRLSELAVAALLEQTA